MADSSITSTCYKHHTRTGIPRLEILSKPRFTYSWSKPKHALIAEKAEGHHAHLASILNGVHRRNRWRNGQHKSGERRAEPAGPTWMHSFTRAFLSTGHVKEPDPPGARSVEHPDRLECRLQKDHAALSFEIGFSIR